MEHEQIACLIYDFDKTLSPRDMQEYGFLPGLNIDPDRFWAECREFAVANRMDAVLAYMYKMHEKAQSGAMPLTRRALMALGEKVAFFPGVQDWFARVNEYGRSIGLLVEHYIISSGLQEIIEGSAIASEFRAIFAAAFLYGNDGRAIWPASAVNYTSKTQYLFRINKGILDVTNDRDLNDFTPEDLRRIPFPNMIYVGDGLTDVPSMKMTRSKGGVSIAVHPPGDTALVDAMLTQERADFALAADYRAGGEMESTVFMLLKRIKAHDDASRLHNRQLYDALQRLTSGPQS
jgi:hypothetical protein